MSDDIQLPSEEVKEVETPVDESLLASESDPVKEEALPSEETKEDVSEEDKSEDKPEEKADEKPEEKLEEPSKDNWAAKYIEEFEKTGDVSDDSVKELVSNYNVPEELVRNYIEMSKATNQAAQDAAAAEIHKTVGGKDAYEAMIKWGSENLSEKEIAAFDSKISLDMDSAHMAVAWLKQKYTDAGNAGTFIEGKAATTNPGYKNADEFQKDLADPRYDRDPAYRSKIDAKLARTTIKLY